MGISLPNYILAKVHSRPELERNMRVGAACTETAGRIVVRASARADNFAAYQPTENVTRPHERWRPAVGDCVNKIADTE